MSSTATKHQASRSEISPRDIDVMMATAALRTTHNHKPSASSARSLVHV